MEPITQQQCNEFYLKDTKFRVFADDNIISVYNVHHLSRADINAAIRYMILEAIIEIGTYQVNVYSENFK
jgi:hypothetical protein|tara:strand:- start:1436 stop:1645 length:210 start_codon:yes stop_codon:yes gene_type:complete